MESIEIVDRMPLCATCLHFDSSERGFEACRAFPEGIPKDILTWKADHRKPYLGDRGFRYKGSDGASSEA